MSSGQRFVWNSQFNKEKNVSSGQCIRSQICFGNKGIQGSEVEIGGRPSLYTRFGSMTLPSVPKTSRKFVCGKRSLYKEIMLQTKIYSSFHKCQFKTKCATELETIVQQTLHRVIIYRALWGGNPWVESNLSQYWLHNQCRCFSLCLLPLRLLYTRRPQYCILHLVFITEHDTYWYLCIVT